MKKSPSLLFYAVTLLLSIVVAPGAPVFAQAHSFERTFPNALSEVQRVVDGLRSSSSGRLPILDGFVDVADHPLTDYQRGYFVCTLRVLPAPNGGALVQATAKITAWYMDPTSSQPGYRELVSNGRVETEPAWQPRREVSSLARSRLCSFSASQRHKCNAPATWQN